MIHALPQLPPRATGRTGEPIQSYAPCDWNDQLIGRINRLRARGIRTGWAMEVRDQQGTYKEMHAFNLEDTDKVARFARDITGKFLWRLVNIGTGELVAWHTLTKLPGAARVVAVAAMA